MLLWLLDSCENCAVAYIIIYIGGTEIAIYSTCIILVHLQIAIVSSANDIGLYNYTVKFL